MTKFVKNFLNDFEVVNKYYNYLVEQTKKKEFVFNMEAVDKFINTSKDLILSEIEKLGINS